MIDLNLINIITVTVILLLIFKLYVIVLAYQRRVAVLQNVCAEAYQMAGVYNAPVEVLDNLSAAATGKKIPHATFLPFVSSDTVRDAERWRGFLNSAYIRIFGYTGLFSESNPYGKPWGNYAHFGMEIWTQYTMPEGSDPIDNTRARKVLEAYADKAIAAQKEQTNGQ